MRMPTILILILLALSFAIPVQGGEPKRLLLIGQSPDKHPKRTHEYMPAMRILHKRLQKVPGLKLTVTRADEPWKEGPDLIAKADGVVLFVSEGAKWLHQDPRRLRALNELAKRKGGLVVLHWGMGTRDAKNIDGCLNLFGACHGGPDRKYKVLETAVAAVDGHPVVTGIGDFRARDEFYYNLKQVKAKTAIRPLLKAKIDGNMETVAWAWTRPNGGRSFGFSGLHFHDNWMTPQYERLIVQGILWTMNQPVPKDGVPNLLKQKDIYLP